MSKDSYGGYRIECVFCKSRNVIYPPSDEYITILHEPCLNNDSFPRTFFCLTCDRLNKIPWDKKHEPSRKQTKGKLSKDSGVCRIQGLLAKTAMSLHFTSYVFIKKNSKNLVCYCSVLIFISLSFYR